jgi:predicted Co/Zn/Cd cation transporter (cation efflux family)
VLGIIAGGLQLLFSLPLIAFVPIIGVVASAANAFVLWAVTTNERRLRSGAYGAPADPWARQGAFSAATQPRFGSKPWHKAALVVLIIFGGLLASLIVYAMVVGPTGH